VHTGDGLTISRSDVQTLKAVNLMYVGPRIIVIIEEKETNLMSQLITFYFTSSVLNMFRTLIHYSSIILKLCLTSRNGFTASQSSITKKK